MKNPIEFNSPSSTNTSTCASPWSNPRISNYKNLILEPEFESRRFKFPLGATWLRIVPALRGSNKDWMLGIHSLKYEKGCHVHPKTITLGARSVFDHAYTWLLKNQSDALYSKANKEGYRLLTDPVCLFWILVEENGKPVARLLVANGYDGSRGGSPAIGHQIWQLSKEVDEDGKLLGEPADPIKGVQICVEKRQTAGSRYPSYTVKRGRVTVPIQDMLGKMDMAEVAALTPLEKVIHLPSEEEEWKLLENVIPADTISEIRSSINH